MFVSLIRGAAAGAVGTTVLNTVTYGDMLWRGRGASDVPAEVAEALATKAGVVVPGDAETRANRLSALGALSGLGAGCAVGAVCGLARHAGLRLPLPVGAVAAGVGAMVATDLPIGALGVSDPRTWSGPDWLSDLVPHLAFGLATYATLQSLDAPRRRQRRRRCPHARR
ncbi:hypothetical protein E0L36_00375 [Streptomyces sp. AJS327]|uniref:hypothetical protein n=1 Tax=Streptomyces sp. AJS327 TaxID=2545265 RepID=UPI0015DFD453|nr:hypothetical protein [Streptomyces sp. AJS327]MBA0049422.1 hypothetical protein [Streptomyces sp. AJS327]